MLNCFTQPAPRNQFNTIQMCHGFFSLLFCSRVFIRFVLFLKKKERFLWPKKKKKINKKIMYILWFVLNLEDFCWNEKRNKIMYVVCGEKKWDRRHSCHELILHQTIEILNGQNFTGTKYRQRKKVSLSLCVQNILCHLFWRDKIYTYVIILYQICLLQQLQYPINSHIVKMPVVLFLDFIQQSHRTADLPVIFINILCASLSLPSVMSKFCSDLGYLFAFVFFCLCHYILFCFP